MSPTSPVRGPAAPPRQRLQPGKIVLGLLLVTIGVGWLVDSLGVVDVRWSMLLPVALLVIGVALLATAHRDVQGGLIGAGVVVSVLLLASSLLTFPFTGQLAAIGDVSHRPTSAGELDDGFALAIGSLEVDLRGVPLPDEPVTVEVGAGIGEVVVRVDPDVTIEVDGSAGIGEVLVAGEGRSGLGVSHAALLEGTGPEPALRLEVSIGIGKVEVRR